MPCDTQRDPGQTIQQRAEEIRAAVAKLDRALMRRTVKPVVGPQGAITFQGFPDSDRNRITDACMYRRIMATGSAIAKAEIARAEAIAGKTVDRRVIASGVHSHDGGRSWHGKG